MKEKIELVVFTDDWHGLPFSCKHLLRHFLPEIPLIWVETIGLRSPEFTLYDLRRSFSKIKGWIKPAHVDHTPLPENLSILDPLQIPYNQYRIVRKFNMSKPRIQLLWRFVLCKRFIVLVIRVLIVSLY